MTVSPVAIRITLFVILLSGIIWERHNHVVSSARRIEDVAPIDLSQASYDRRSYSVIAFGNRAGIMQSWSSDSHTQHFHLEFKLNGHGPNVDETVTLNRSRNSDEFALRY